MSTRNETTTPTSLQDLFLNGARRECLHVVIRLVDGTEVDSLIKNIDRFTLLVEREGGDVFVFKHAVVWIRPYGYGSMYK